MKPGVPGQRVGILLAGLGILFAGFVFAPTTGVFTSKNPAQRFEDELRGFLGGKGKTFQAQGVLIENREFRVTVLNPDETKFQVKPTAESALPSDTQLNQDCYRAWQILSIALFAVPDGTDPGYTDYRKWKWPVTVEWSWTAPGTLETKLKSHTFTAAQTQQGAAQCIQS